MVSCQKGYTYPLRYEAQTSFWVSDPYVDNKQARGLAYQYADYTIPALRADEVFNTTSVFGTPFYFAGILSDTHLLLNNSQYYFYTNDSGLVCYSLPIGIFPRDLFSNPSTYVGNVNYNGVECAVYTVVGYPIITGVNVNITLLVGIQSNLPVSSQIAGVPGSLVGNSVGDFIYFKEVASFPANIEKALFSPPQGCPINGTIIDYQQNIPLKIF